MIVNFGRYSTVFCIPVPRSLFKTSENKHDAFIELSIKNYNVELYKIYVEFLKMPRLFQSLKQVLVEQTVKTNFNKRHYYLNFLKLTQANVLQKALHEIRGHPTLQENLKM